jgi:hypothetical protein
MARMPCFATGTRQRTECPAWVLFAHPIKKTLYQKTPDPFDATFDASLLARPVSQTFRGLVTQDVGHRVATASPEGRP